VRVPLQRRKIRSRLRAYVRVVHAQENACAQCRKRSGVQSAPRRSPDSADIEEDEV
jgi:deoxycytidylate deaminase